MEKVYEIYIKATPDRVWEAITNPAVRAKFSFGLRIQSDWQPGSAIETTHVNAPGPLGAGEVVESNPPKRLVHTHEALWNEGVRAEGTSRVTWDLEPIGADSTRLLLIHDEMREGANDQLYGGWPMILSGLKTYVETGEELTTPGSLMFADPAQLAANRS
jgi:uncharacterized protein YndB with AHSA1/START domain